MELKSFIKATITEVVEAVSESRLDLVTHEVGILPSSENDPGTESVSTTSQLDTIQTIHFDIVVTDTASTTSEAGAGVFLSVLSLGAKGSKEEEVVSCNRIQFSASVPIPEIHSINNR
ncbi:hypothetical protein [Gimesia algae]|uniref:Uncharacterized protein n=1 Tax=Gimesia algae TaxID=2527971 RepID=A0A517V7P0_9PLAN|nr:hypothetical protein [Gimesia algae]QDT89020.1 hypothetical protein Pan161_06450 [Gimesia algae]